MEASKKKRLTLWSIIAGLPLIAGGSFFTTIDWLTDTIVFPYLKPRIDTTITLYLEEHPQGSNEQVIGLFEDINTMVNSERDAFLNITRSSHLMYWHHMSDTIVKGYKLKYQDHVFYTMHNGIVFEATYKRSARKFYFIDPYGTEMEALKEPDTH